MSRHSSTGAALCPRVLLSAQSAVQGVQRLLEAAPSTSILLTLAGVATVVTASLISSAVAGRHTAEPGSLGIVRPCASGDPA